MTADSATRVDARDASATARIATIEERLTLLRQQTAEIALRASVAADHAREVRLPARVGCTHADQVAAMQEALDVVSAELDGLRIAMHTRGVIEQAKGILMLHRQCDADAAFELLVELSQRSHRKLVEVAGTLVESWTTGHGPT